MYRDIYGASQLGIKTIFVDSNQGAKFYENVIPDYFAPRFEDVLKGVEALKGVKRMDVPENITFPGN